jgi:iron complex transport system permease protein
MKKFALLPSLLIAIAVFAGLSLMAGKVWAPLSAWVDTSDPRWAIIFELRLPRTLLAILVGAALGMAGAALQGYTRNPLADPAVLGVSSSAALGAVLTLYFGLTAAAPWILPLASISGAMLGVALLLSLSGVTGSVITFLLAGVVLQTLGAASVALALSLAPNPWATQEIMDWIMGALSDRSMEEVRLAAPFILIGMAVLYTLRRSFDALTLGEASAASLGVDLKRTQVLLGLGVGLTVGASVAVTGIVGFVGLIVPHILRQLVGAEPGKLLIPSALGGALLVLLADIAVRIAPTSSELKLGIAMSAIGGPFFIAMLVSMRRRLA